MTWIAHIDTAGDAFFRQTVRLLIANRHSDGSLDVLREGGMVSRIQSNEVAPADVGFTLPADALPAVLGALSHHLGAVEHPEQLRRDYDAERRRVDKFIDAAIAARTP